MKKIRYTENAVYKVIAEYEFKTINTPDGSFISYLIIYTAVNNFMEYNPPCKECLIQTMCIREDLAHPTRDSMPDHLHIKTCTKLKDFVTNHKLFYTYGDRAPNERNR